MNARLRVVAASLIVSALAPSLASSAAVERGIRAGLNLASFRGSLADLAELESKQGFVGGAYMAYRPLPGFAIQPEALFSTKGAKVLTEGTDRAGNPTGTVTSQIDLNYVELPILVRVELPVLGAVRSSLLLGPSFGILLSGRVRNEATMESGELEHLKAIDIGGTLGLALRTGAGPLKLLADARYTTGLSDIYDIDGNLESINNVFSFTTGVAIE